MCRRELDKLVSQFGPVSSYSMTRMPDMKKSAIQIRSLDNKLLNFSDNFYIQFYLAIRNIPSQNWTKFLVTI